MNTDSPIIHGAGYCCEDHLVYAPRVPWGGSAPAQGYEVQGGGLIATALVTCARLGASCRLTTLLGDDVRGSRLLDELTAEGIDCRSVDRIAGAQSPVSFIAVDANSGERTIFFYRDRSLRWDPSRKIKELDNAAVLLVDDTFPELGRAAASRARALGIPVVADTTPDEFNRDFIAEIDILIAPQSFLAVAGLGSDLNRGLELIRSMGPRTAVITLGAKGWAALDDSGRHCGAAFKVDPVDTTGAGDVFHGAYAFGVARGWPTTRCAQFASSAAALKCTRRGGRAGIPTFHAAEHFMKNQLEQSTK